MLVVAILSLFLAFLFKQKLSLPFALFFLAFLPFSYGIPTYFHTALVIDKANIRYLIMDNMLESALDLERKEEPVFSYIKAMKEIAKAFSFKAKPEKIAVIGAGGCSSYYFLHQLFPSSKIYFVDIDAKVFDICREYFCVNESPAVLFVVEDGRKFLEKEKGFDIIIVDAYSSGCAVPSHLITKEFFSVVKSSLSPGGLFMANIILNENPRLLSYLYNTIAFSFPDLKYVKTSFSSPSNYVFFSSLAIINTTNLSYPVQSMPGNSSLIITDDKNPVEVDYSFICLS